MSKMIFCIVNNLRVKNKAFQIMQLNIKPNIKFNIKAPNLANSEQPLPSNARTNPRLLFTFGTGAKFPAYQPLDISFEPPTNGPQLGQNTKIKSLNQLFDEKVSANISIASNGKLTKNVYTNANCTIQKLFVKLIIKIIHDGNQTIELSVPETCNLKHNSTDPKSVQLNLLEKSKNNVIALLTFENTEITDKFINVIQDNNNQKPISILNNN